MVAWGDNNDSKCVVPKEVKDAVCVSAGARHSLALSDNGDVISWGSKNNSRCDVPEGLKVAKPIGGPVLSSSDPPILSINTSTIELIDVNENELLTGNGALDATDVAELKFTVRNDGPGIGRKLSADVKVTGATSGLNWVSPWPIPNIPSGQSVEASLKVHANRNTVNGKIQVKIEVNEPNGFSPEPLNIEIETRAFQSPKLEVVDFSSSSKIWEPNTPIELDVLVQNIGLGEALDVQVELSLPDVVNCYSKNTTIEIPLLGPGEVIPLKYDMIIPRSFNSSKVEATITVTEIYGDYGTAWNHGFPFDTDSTSDGLIAIEASASAELSGIERASLSSSAKAPARVSFNEVPKDVIVETVAVVPVDGKDCKGQTISGQDIASFTEGSLLGLYNVVERRNLERVLDEQRLALSGVLYEQSAVEAGCNVGAQGIIFTEYGCLTGQETIQLKLVDCQTSELYWSATGVNATAQETLDKVRQELEGQ